MSLLKIRDEDGNIHSIAIMKGDKIVAKDPAILSNTEDDTSVTSVSITKRGLYDVRVRVYFPNSSEYSPFFRSVLSVSDLNDSFDHVVGGRVSEYSRKGSTDTYDSLDTYIVRYENGTISSQFFYTVTYDEPDPKQQPKVYLSEVRLLIPYD